MTAHADAGTGTELGRAPAQSDRHVSRGTGVFLFLSYRGRDNDSAVPEAASPSPAVFSLQGGRRG